MEAGDSELAIGTVIGPYRIEALVGEGGMGKVFRAMRQGETEPVALKVMRSRLSGEEEPRRRFLREALSPREIVELLMVIGQYMMLARVMATVEMELDEPAATAVIDASGAVVDRSDQAS